MSISSIQAMIVADPFLQLIIAGVVAALLITVIGLFSARARRRSASTAPHTASNDNVRAANPPARPVAQPVAQVVPAAPAPAPAASPVVPAAPIAGAQLGVGRAWSDMPGGWQALRTMAANADLPVHGLFPINDGVARTMAGKIVASGSGASWPSMPGGWAALTGGAVSASAPVASAPAAPVAEQAAPAAVFEAAAAAAAAVATATGSGNGTAAVTDSGASGTASWASMPGGWQALKASGVATNIASHGDYPLGDGVARTPAGTIVR